MELITLAIISIFIILLGLAGLILPFVPDVLLSWLGFFVFAFGSGFELLSLNTVLIFLGLSLLVFIFDFLAPIIGAKRCQASKLGLAGASAGLLLGILLFGPFGIILGPLLGALAGELLTKKEMPQIFKSVKGIIFGFLFALLLKIVLIFVMLGFVIKALF